MKYVSYEGPDEVLVCALEEEYRLLEQYFENATGRDILDYDRTIHTKGIVEIKANISIRSDIKEEKNIKEN